MSDSQVIISMTSIPSRNGTLSPTLLSLVNQSRKPDQIRIYLTEGCERPRAEAVWYWDEMKYPSNKRGVDDLTPQIFWTTDHGPLTKLSAAVDPSVPGDALIVTVDDDIIYDSNWLEVLTDAAKAMPDEALGFSGWNAWSFLNDPDGGHYVWATLYDACDVIEGWSGAAYRKRWFGADLFTAPETFRYVDDVWISGYLHKRGIKRRVIRQPMCHPKPALEQLVGLHDRSDFVELNRQAARIAFANRVEG